MNIHSVPDLSFVDKALNRHLRRMRAALRVASSAINAGALQGALGPLCLAGWEAIYGLEVHGLGVNDPLTAIANINGAIHAIYGIEAMLDRLPRPRPPTPSPRPRSAPSPRPCLAPSPRPCSKPPPCTCRTSSCCSSPPD